MGIVVLDAARSSDLTAISDGRESTASGAVVAFESGMLKRVRDGLEQYA